MSIIDSENMTVKIYNEDVSIYCEQVSESGGKPEYEVKKKWNNTLTQALIGYDDWNISLNLNVSKNPSIISNVIGSFNNNVTTTIDLGVTGVRRNVYSNAIPESSDYKISSDGDIQIAELVFRVPGMASNKQVL